jgi:hypothetical protein
MFFVLSVIHKNDKSYVSRSCLSRILFDTLMNSQMKNINLKLSYKWAYESRVSQFNKVTQINYRTDFVEICC